MPWQTPLISEVRKQSRDAVAAAMSNLDALPPRSPASIVSDNNAGLAYLCLLYLDWQSRQYLPDTAEAGFLGRWGDILFGGRKAATFASGSMSFTGTSGIAVPAGTQVSGQGAAGVVLFETMGAVTSGSSATVAPIRALAPEADSNLDAGAPLSLTVAIPGINASGAVVALTGGAEAESDDDLRTHVLARLRETPMGGAAHDYVAWALELPGVTRAWVSPREMGIGTVTLRFMMDDLRAAQDGFPDALDAAVVAKYLETRRPVTAMDLFVVPPIPQDVDFRLNGLVSDDASTRANIAASTKAMLRERAAPAFALNGERQPAQTIYSSWVSEAVSRAAGVEHFDLVMEDAVMASPGHMGVLGSIILG